MPGRAEYRALVEKVEAFAARAHAAQAPWLRCRAGCDGCCRTRRSAWAVEIDALRTHLATLPPERQSELAARREDPAVVAGARCVYLDPDGRCAVYAARPVICRTHGPAVRLPDGETVWCGLNFEGLDEAAVLAALPADAVLDLDLLNRMLALVNARYLQSRDRPARDDLGAALDP
ncbi:MAG: YkgJ family cysteine cluster protein [Myxococcales bacterium]|nr:YkgJ family cysteine cluster protein [Myxococcales bacterium]